MHKYAFAYISIAWLLTGSCCAPVVLTSDAAESLLRSLHSHPAYCLNILHATSRHPTCSARKAYTLLSEAEQVMLGQNAMLARQIFNIDVLQPHDRCLICSIVQLGGATTHHQH